MQNQKNYKERIMGNESDYNLKLEELKTIPSHKAKSPTVPVGICIEEAEYLATWSERDREPLEAAGLSWPLVEDIPIRSGALRQAQSLWFTAVNEDNPDTELWAAGSKEASDFRTVLKHKLSFAFRNNPQLMARIRVVNKGHRQSDLLQALNDLCAMGRKHQELLTAVNIDLALLDRATQYSDELTKALSISQSRKDEATELRILRDKAYLHLKEAVDEVRGYGRYLFWRTPERYMGYISKYYRNSKPAAGGVEPAGDGVEPELETAAVEAVAPAPIAETVK
ncbi:MAG: hypothetical protein GY765_42415 [bacterium]|nr:hypothetical protein [bacterium]